LNNIDKCNIAVFASGSGSNFINIYNHICDNNIEANLKLLISNNSYCNAVIFAKENGIPFKIINDYRFGNSSIDNVMFETLQINDVDLIILAGYMKKIPSKIIECYTQKILNIHPSLLPKYGGKGFYGIKVHQAVINSNEKVTGITIHFVDASYDTGDIIYQEKINVLDNDNSESLAARVLQLEHRKYPEVIKEICQKINRGSIEKSIN
tara:strand:+ start:146 stop:772 length:627 start_codon:yes stop_codon:yes gene_type:complete